MATQPIARASTASKGTRMLYMDVLKCFAIFLVLAGHCVQYLRSSQFADEPGYRLIYSFHMPLFMMVTGYFFVLTYRGTFLANSAKKFRQLIIPVLTWGVLFAVGRQILVGLPSVMDILNYWATGFWFLKCAFLCCLLGSVPFGLKSVNLLWGGVITLLMSQFVHIGNLQIPFMYPCFFAGGLLACKSADLAKCRGLFWPSLLIFLILLLFLDSDTYTSAKDAFENGLWHAPAHYTLLRVYLLVLGLSGAMFFILLFKRIVPESTQNRVIGKIAEVGTYTLGIYVIQCFVLEWFLAKHLCLDNAHPMVFNLVYVPLISLGLLIALYGVLRLMRRSALLSFLFLGGPLNARSCGKIAG